MSDWNVLYDKIVVRRHAPDSELAPGVVAAEAHQKEKNRGTVIAVGAGRLAVTGSLNALTVQAGMEVIFSKFAGTELEDGNSEVIIMREDEILAFRWPEEEKEKEEAA